MVIVSLRALSGQTYQKKEWRPMLSSEHSYRLSCFAPLFMAFGVSLRLNVLFITCPWFPWNLFVLTLMLQALVTYKGDVSTFGRASWWKVGDVWLALVHSLCFGALVIFPLVGWSTWSRLASVPLALSLPLALWYKWQATEALKRDDPASFFPLHAGWHWLLLMGSLSALTLL